MGMIGSLLGAPGAVSALGATAKQVAEVFIPNATRKVELSAEAYSDAVGQYGAEFKQTTTGWFDRFINGLNRLPRPMLALGTMGLFVYAMVDPAGFTPRMQGLAFVPEPLWWLLGAIVSFYFGAREAYYFRERTGIPPRPAGGGPVAQTDDNPALADWRAANG